MIRMVLSTGRQTGIQCTGNYMLPTKQTFNISLIRSEAKYGMTQIWQQSKKSQKSLVRHSLHKSKIYSDERFRLVFKHLSLPLPPPPQKALLYQILASMIHTLV